MKKINNILIISESIDINDSSASKGRVALINNLKKAGFDLKVYHYTRRPIALEGIDCVAITEQKFTFGYVMSKFQLFIRRLTTFNLNPFVEKWIGFSFAFFNDSYSIKKALQKEDPNDYKWILTLSKAASFRPHKALLSLPQWHSKWLAYIHDPYPMHFYPRPYTWVEPGHYQKQEFMRAVSKACAYGVFPSKLLQEWMGSYFPDFLERGFVIPHQLTQTQNPKKELPEYFKTDLFTVLHAGALMKQRNPKALIEGFELFLNNVPEAINISQLLLLGSHDYHKNFLEVKKQALSNLYLSPGYVPFDEVQLLQFHAEVNVIIEAKAEISPFLPGKFPHCIAAGKPILHLGPALSETRRLLGENYPYAAEIDATETIAQLLEVLYKNWKSGNIVIGYDENKLKQYLGVVYLKETLRKQN
ncbi:MAG: UDP-glycosyltransferase [Flavobacteriales bacterium]|nr:UDP-glycosyltransferase [Flavobacteriales bacterium]